MDWSGDSTAEISTHGPFIFFISLRRQKGAHELSQAAAGEREGCSAWVEGDTGQSSTKQYVLVKVRPEKSCSHLTVFLHVTVALRASNHCIRTNIYVGRRRGTRRRKATQRSIMLFLSPSPARPLSRSSPFPSSLSSDSPLSLPSEQIPLCYHSSARAGLPLPSSAFCSMNGVAQHRAVILPASLLHRYFVLSGFAD